MGASGKIKNGQLGCHGREEGETLMYKHKSNHFCKAVTAGILSAVLVLSGVCILPGAGHKAQAAETYYWTEEFADIGSYVEGTTERVAPKPTNEQHRDWLFAGWFTDGTCTTPYTGISGKAVAKFVRSEVLSVKTQILANTDLEHPSGKLRIVSTVDSLDYKVTGFDITINGTKRSFESTKAYRKIVASEGGVAVGYQPQDLSGDARYFITGTLTGIPATAVSQGILVTPWWETMDGTKVEGVSRYARVDDAYNQICNVPIRLYDEEDVAAGYLEVAYDSSVFTYVGSDAGSVFEEMETADAAKDGKRIVRCVGNVKDISKNKRANGLYINLRFQLAKDAVLSQDAVFEVSGAEFYDNGEAKKDTYVPEGVYRMLAVSGAKAARKW